MSYRILHLADLHLERAFAGMGCHGELARRRRQGLRDALRRAGEQARSRRCDAVTIGGDLYESERAGPDTARFLAETFESWQPLPVLLAPGNHDPLMEGSLYATTGWPANVHLFPVGELTPRSMAGGPVIWGLAHGEPAWDGNPFACSRPRRSMDVHVALFHGAELGFLPAGKAAHGPFHAEQIHDMGFAAALCGHYHRRRLDATTGLAYPGSPEPLTFDETGGRGPIIAEVDSAGRVAFEPLNLNTWSAVSVEVDLEGCTSPTLAVDRISAAALASTAGLDLDRTMMSVELRGDVPADLALDVYSLETAAREAAGLAALRMRDLTRTDIDVAAVADERTARGAFVRRVQAALASHRGEPAEVALLEDALRYGLQALSGREVGLR